MIPMPLMRVSSCASRLRKPPYRTDPDREIAREWWVGEEKSPRQLGRGRAPRARMPQTSPSWEPSLCM